MSPIASRRAAVAASLAVAVVVAVVVVVVVIATGGGGSPVPRAPRPTPTSPAVAPPVPTRQFGASVNLLFNTATVGAAERDAQLKALGASGATLGRSDALWELTEPSPPAGGMHRYNWQFDDLIAGSLAANHLRWLPIVDYTAGWAQSIPGQDHSPPSSSADYAAYAAALAARYGAGGSFWRAHPELPVLPVAAFEIWNEPDSTYFWTPHPDAARYAQLYAAASEAIHTVDRGARVMVGGLSAPLTFLPQLLTADPGLRGTIDGVAIHPYAGSPAGVLANVRHTRRVLQGLGLGTVPLYVTEFGWTTSPPGALDYLAAPLRPGYVERALTGLARTPCDVAATTLYTWFSPRRDPRNSEDWFGISPPGAAGSPEVTAFTSALRLARSTSPRRGRC